MNCCASLVKYILYIFNVLFVVIGALLIVLGSLMLQGLGNFTKFNNLVNINIIPIIIISFGALIFLISIVGCCGTICNNPCLTYTYAALMLILFGLQVAFTVWVFDKRSRFLSTMGNVVDTAWQENNNANGYPMDALQLALTCCGNRGYEDYLSAGATVPGTCCGYASRLQPCEEAIYSTRKGCKQTFVDFWAKNTNIIRWTGIGIALFELAVFVIACCLAHSMRKTKHGDNLSN